jgi:HOOK domain
LGYQLASFEEPNISKIGEHADPHNLTQLLQLVLGCAVQCANKKGMKSNQSFFLNISCTDFVW